MSEIFEALEATAAKIIEKLSAYDAADEVHDFPWPNYIYTSKHFRRAHLDIVDVRDTKKLYMMHLCIFPNTTDSAPIFGFDIIAGPKKVTGAFHDFSPVGEDHEMLRWFDSAVSELSWHKTRQMPPWAKAIFSDKIVAAGNIKDIAELDQLLSLVMNNLEYYLASIGGAGGDWSAKQKAYCVHQKQNPHTEMVMASLGYDVEMVKSFINNCLFPE